MIHFERFLDLLQQVETGAEENGGEGAIGDEGKALGPLQIHEPCYRDAMEHLANSLGLPLQALLQTLPYKFCAHELFSRVVAYIYLKRYCQNGMKNGNWEELARTWNGGPTWFNSDKGRYDTEKYWKKVRAKFHKYEKGV